MSPYVVVTPIYRDNSNGVRVLHKLVHDLNERGYEAYCTSTPNPLWNEPLITKEKITEDFIVVYPEIIAGNPVGIHKVVRWALNKPGFLGGEPFKDGLQFSWYKKYLDKPLLTVNTIEPELFTKGTNDKFDCFYRNKGWKKPRVPMVEELREIIDCPSRWAYADLLKNTRIVYTYDDDTQLIYEAMLCGCRVIVVPENIELKKEDYDKKYSKYNKNHKKQLDRFIKLTQKLV